MRLTRIALALVSVAVWSASPALAQSKPKPDTRIPAFALDLRGVFGRLGQDTTTAAGLSTAAVNLPSTGLGAAGGAHIYFLRGESFAFGAGGEAAFARASHTVLDSSGKATGTVIDRRLQSVSGNVSFNFGHRAGWSYITAGIGPTSFESYLAGATRDGLRTASLNYGAGARWFNIEHIAFTVDMRFYQTKPALATPNTAARARHNVIVFSAGISFK